MLLSTLQYANQPAHRLPKVIKYWLGMIGTPTQSIYHLCHETSTWPGLFAALLYALLYMVTELILIGRELPLSSPPILLIPEQSYYFWQFFFTLPVALLAWLLLSETAYQVATQRFGGQGTRQQYRNLLSFTFHVPFTVTLWVAETSTALFWPALWGNPAAPGAAVGQWIWQSLLWIGLLWSVLLSGQAVKMVSGLSWLQSVITSAIAIIVTIGFYMIFIR